MILLSIIYCTIINKENAEELFYRTCSLFFLIALFFKALLEA